MRRFNKLGPDGANAPSDRRGSRRRPRLRGSTSMAVASLALFVALGGTGYAANQSQPGNVTAKAAKKKKKGARGPAGPVGPAGPRGLAGLAGPAGPVGPGGPAGPVGPAGAAGAQGTQGAQGAQGAAGPAGPVSLKYVTTEVANPAGQQTRASAECPAATPNVVGGGVFSSGGYNIQRVNSSNPFDGNDADAIPDDGWRADVDAFSPGGTPTITVYAICTSATSISKSGEAAQASK